MTLLLWNDNSGGGLTVLSNLRLLQRQACKRKKNKLEFLVPWWDFQLGISVNQFLSVFASSNSDFRHVFFFGFFVPQFFVGAEWEDDDSCICNLQAQSLFIFVL